MKRARTICVLAAASSLAAAAHGDLVEYRFGGTVTSIDGAGAGPWSDVTIGDAYVYSIIIDLDTPDESGTPTIGQYAAESITLSIGDVSDDLFRDTSVAIFDSFNDLFIAGGEYFDDLDGAWRAEVTLEDFAASAFNSDALPTSLDLGAFEDRRMRLRRLTEFLGPGDPFELEATIDTFTFSVVPAPGAGVALLVLFTGRRRRRRLSHHP